MLLAHTCVPHFAKFLRMYKRNFFYRKNRGFLDNLIIKKLTRAGFGKILTRQLFMHLCNNAT